MKRLLDLLKNTKEVSDYKITEIKTHSYQLFYVKDRLETNRVSDSSEIEATIYVDENGMRGSASFKYADYLSDKELSEKLEEGIFNAKLSLNPPFTLPKAQPAPEKLVSNLADREFKDIAEDVAKAVFANKMSDALYSAATEIFINKVEKHIFNSQGLDNNETRYYGEIELIPSYDTKEKEVEIYHMARFSNFDFDAIKNEVGEVLKMVEDRYNAIDLPKDVRGINIIIDGEEVGQVFGYFSQDLNYAQKFMRSNLFELGSSVQGEQIVGTKLNLTAAPGYLGASASRSIDSDGISLKPRCLVKDGIAESRFGNNQFGCYLQEKDITGELPVLIVKNGDVSFKEMAKKPYIRCVRFSAMQMDRMTGLVGGEVRLGYYFDGKKEIPVTGFTFTGNLHELKGMMVYSSEEVTYSRYHGPKYILLPKTNII